MRWKKLAGAVAAMTVVLSLPAVAAPTAAPPAPEKPGEAVVLRLPTENDALFRGHPEDFFQTTISKRQISGMYGFVRTNGPEPARYFERFHEGLDIMPVRRNTAGIPLDPVRAAAPGEVVFVNTVPSRSAYGYYVIIRHRYGPWEAYTTYGHMASVNAKAGQLVEAGAQIGVLGHTGNVDSLAKSHLHFEFGFMVTRYYDKWFDKFAERQDGTNFFGNYNGLNFLGVDPQVLLEATRKGEPLTIPEIFARERAQFRVRVPAAKDYFDWQRRFPEMTAGGLDGPQPVSWEIDCDRIGIPLKFTRSNVPCDSPVLVWFDESLSLQDSFTRGLVSGRKGNRELSRHGYKWLSQLTWVP